MRLQARNDFDLGSTEALEELLRAAGKPHFRLLTPPVGEGEMDGHRLIVLAPQEWRAAVLAFFAPLCPPGPA
ncbi:hypothetical protein [Deinococcus hopiensis]|uniref:Uncharacterized protein n=1 Tax=Deinococcus hopiensis KR-140 TaxID=695939 RepID=A0A1W1VVY9_9DEIO|nr:hypothetical protein [Deinococcus hopiensis]SMB97537.1 hypothetical protein SAMN00790413_06031 [Deinococcus hopiensis KR-140]